MEKLRKRGKANRDCIKWMMKSYKIARPLLYTTEESEELCKIARSNYLSFYPNSRDSSQHFLSEHTDIPRNSNEEESAISIQRMVNRE